MALPPQKFREIVFQILFSSDFLDLETEQTALMLMKELKVTRKAVLEANSQVLQILEKLPQIDEKISLYSTDYAFERISRVEKTILRLGLFELEKLPPLIAIAEAIRLTRKFGTPESAQFVNAILDKAMHAVCNGSQPV